MIKSSSQPSSSVPTQAGAASLLINADPEMSPSPAPKSMRSPSPFTHGPQAQVKNQTQTAVNIQHGGQQGQSAIVASLGMSSSMLLVVISAVLVFIFGMGLGLNIWARNRCVANKHIF